MQDGQVVAWDVYTTRGRRSQAVHLQIWRPVRPADNRYRFVGETVTVALWVGHSRFVMYPRDRISVRRGDVIGIYFPKYNPIPWSAADCSHGNEHLYKYSPYTCTGPIAEHLYKYSPYTCTGTIAVHMYKYNLYTCSGTSRTPVQVVHLYRHHPYTYTSTVRMPVQVQPVHMYKYNLYTCSGTIAVHMYK